MTDSTTDPEFRSMLIDIRNSQWPLIISFAGLGDQFQFAKSLDSLNVNVIYLRDLKHNWYLNGVPGIGGNVGQIAEFLNTKIKEGKYTKVITIGASAGGYAALLYGALLNANVILAFSPQTFIDHFHRLIYWDRRWQDRIAEIYSSTNVNRSYLDLKPLLKKYNGDVKLFFDKFHRIDAIHAKRLTIKNVTYFSSDIGGHALVKHLKENGKLKEYIEHAL